jgi:hypothetical protein
MFKLELKSLIDNCERLDEDTEAAPRLKAALAWLEGWDWWMILGYDDGTRIAPPNAPKKPRGVPKNVKGYLIEASPRKRGYSVSYWS